MTDITARVVLDQAREPWMVEQVSSTPKGTLLNFRHDLGYELPALADRPLGQLHDEALTRLLEAARRRRPRTAVAEAA